MEEMIEPPLGPSRPPERLSTSFVPVSAFSNGVRGRAYKRPSEREKIGKKEERKKEDGKEGKEKENWKEKK